MIREANRASIDEIERLITERFGLNMDSGRSYKTISSRWNSLRLEDRAPSASESPA